MVTEVLKMLPEDAGRGQHCQAGKLLIYFFQALKRKKKSRKKTHASVTVTVIRDRKTRTALRTNQIAGFVTVSAWKNIKMFIQNNLPLKS